MQKKNIITLAILLGFLTIIFLFILSETTYFKSLYSKNNKNNIPFEIVAENLDIPWEIVFLPNGERLVTERPGNLVRIGKNKTVIKMLGVKHVGEGGLLGLALHPKFDNNSLIYLYFTSEINGKTENRVERYEFDLDKNVIKNKKLIIDNIPGASYHDGGRIAFYDNFLYITTGDAGNPELAQDINSLAGKILRLKEDGSIPIDNPFNSPVYSYGHRNSQGLAWDNQGRLWATEHGRSSPSGYDELNLIEKRKNYGWPEIQGDEEKQGMEKPIIHSGSVYTWAPAGAVYYNGDIFFTGLRGEALYQYNINEKTLKEHFKNQFGRLRAITINNNSLYVSTSNRDGRGNEKEGDDKIIKIRLSGFY
ncbi:PQQ-dependent sugar dehydrogenase [Candidatus Pacearchaeota archaeon]|nr:PQQ-dependent sugar dehydrogenase [Candidatus Pacearchaeota archaeon]